jgi:hypothetical protein
MRLPTIIWSYENEERGWFVGTYRSWEVRVSYMKLCWWISVHHKNHVIEMQTTQEDLGTTVCAALSLFYFHYTEKT